MYPARIVAVATAVEGRARAGKLPMADRTRIHRSARAVSWSRTAASASRKRHHAVQANSVPVYSPEYSVPIPVAYSHGEPNDMQHTPERSRQ